MRLVKLATCNLNQWAMDFSGNLARIKQSIEKARDAGAVYRVGPELEITGYGCEDHFLEHDTCSHSWESLAEILSSNLTYGIVCDIGLPVEQGGVRYNCRAFCLDGRILLIRPKVFLANDGNYRELRWFSAWKHKHLVDLQLPEVISTIRSQKTVMFGDGYLLFDDTAIGSETCEELFTPNATHISLSLSGVEIIANGSGSHHQLRKLNTRLELMQSATSKAGGVYLYANQQGCDGGRLYYGAHNEPLLKFCVIFTLSTEIKVSCRFDGQWWVCLKISNQLWSVLAKNTYIQVLLIRSVESLADGCASAIVNGDVVAQGSQFSLQDVEVVLASVDLDTVLSYRGAISSLREQASHQLFIPYVKVNFRLSKFNHNLKDFPTLPVQIRYHVPEEEIALGPACWLWDYLRRSGATGYLLPLSGGADSSAVAAIVGSMCQLVIRAIEEGNKTVLSDALRIGQYDKDEKPTSSQEFASRVLHSIYMGSENSSEATTKRAETLANEIGATHINLKIDIVVSALLSLFSTVTGLMPRYQVDGGSRAENLARQNLQARIRMVIAFMFASLLPWVKSKAGFFLVLGSANVDEGLRGYLTKYDCSSADVNPIGGISKQDLRLFLHWSADHLGYATLQEVVAAPPTAELEPTRADYTQTDEEDMGMTYAELSMYGRLRKIFRCGPVSMFMHLCHRWQGRFTPAEVATKVKDFFRFYSINRHKMTTLTPSYHAENYSPEDNRFDLRQFLYNTKWPWQFQKIDDLVKRSEDSGVTPTERKSPLDSTDAELAGRTANSSGLGVPAASSGNPHVGKGT